MAELSPAQELRAAASKIREIVAKTSHTGPWLLRDWSVMTESGPIAEVHELGDAEHVALWHPGVAELIADWLDAEANHFEPLWKGPHVPDQLARALAVARAINGGA